MIPLHTSFAVAYCDGVVCVRILLAEYNGVPRQ